MPALDRFQPIVVNALQKDGWQITDSPFTLRVNSRLLFIDLKAQHKENSNEIIVVEVKGFEGQSPIHDLEQAIGQYVIYRVLLKELDYNYPLYLAIPESIYQTIFQERVGRVIQQALDVKIMIIDNSQEEIVRWIE